MIATKKPFVSEAIVGGSTERRLVVMAVPTRDERGRISGVVAGGIILQQSSNDARANDLGYAGLQVLDRDGQRITLRNLARPRNAELVAQLRKSKEGVVIDTLGLDGSGGRVIAFASSPAPGWTTVIDQPTSTVFGAARRSLLLEALLVGAAVVVVLSLIAWAFRRARRDLRSSRAQVGRWAQLTRSLNEAVDADGIRDILATALASEFPEASVIVSLHHAELGEPGSTGVARGQRSSFIGLDEGAALSIAEAVAGTGEPIALETRSELRDHMNLRETAAQQARSLYGVSLLDEARRPVGAATLLFAVEQAVSSYELALVQAHADQAGQALARVRRHEEEHDVAVLLQQSLLPDQLPETEGVEVAAYYRAGVANTNVGGDWYDVVRRPDGILHLTVGDVAGRGIDAAVSMGQLRHAFRAYALDHVSPAAVIERVARHVGEDGMATMVCVTYDPYTRELAYSSAGHLPPLIVDPVAETVMRLDRVSSGPLGWLSPGASEDERATVPPGTTLAMYTDGLVERRGSILDEGIDRLGSVILEALPGEPREIVDGVVDRIVESRVDDDLALLLVRLEAIPSVLRIDLPAEPQLLRELRRRVRAWLTHRGLDESAREAAVLAMSEACNNAIEHGYQHAQGIIRVRLDHRGASLAIGVADDGSWREPVLDSTRGRGIPIMRGLMDEAEIVRRPHGTEVVLEQRL